MPQQARSMASFPLLPSIQIMEAWRRGICCRGMRKRCSLLASVQISRPNICLAGMPAACNCSWSGSRDPCSGFAHPARAELLRPFLFKIDKPGIGRSKTLGPARQKHRGPPSLYVAQNLSTALWGNLPDAAPAGMNSHYVPASTVRHQDGLAISCLDHKAKIFAGSSCHRPLWKVSGLKTGGSWLDKQFIAMNLMRFRQICQATRHKPCHNVFARCQDFCPAPVRPERKCFPQGGPPPQNVL